MCIKGLNAAKKMPEWRIKKKKLIFFLLPENYFNLRGNRLHFQRMLDVSVLCRLGIRLWSKYFPGGGAKHCISRGKFSKFSYSPCNIYHYTTCLVFILLSFTKHDQKQTKSSTYNVFLIPRFSCFKLYCSKSYFSFYFVEI